MALEKPAAAGMSTARRDAWEQMGVIAPLYLRPSQLDIYELILTKKNPFIEAARRFGKTTSVLCYVLEKLRQNPGWVARWCEPLKNQCRDIVMPEIEKIQSTFPRHLKFQYQTTDSVYIAPWGSRLYLRGVNEDRGESARGPTSNIIICDEFGSWRDPEYTVNEVLRPQLMTTNGQLIIMSSPAVDLGHPYYEHQKLAVREERFIQKTIYDNESLSPAKIQEIIQEVGGEHKPAWQREYLCKPVSDPERLVVPEFNEDLHTVSDDYPEPTYFHYFCGIDLGFNDNTAAVYGLWDFERAELVISDEFVCNGRSSKEIADGCKGVEHRNWPGRRPKLRIGDNDKQQLFDMLTLCDFQVLPTKKDDKLAAINAVRLRFSSGKIKIKRRCKNLIYQLKVGLWNERRTDYQRGEKTGHLDCIDALVYLGRSITPYQSLNPFPQGLGESVHTHHINPNPIDSRKDEGALKNAFRPLSKG